MWVINTQQENLIGIYAYGALKRKNTILGHNHYQCPVTDFSNYALVMSTGLGQWLYT